MTRRTGYVDIRNIFTASGVSFLTGIIPEVQQLPSNGELLFVFPDTEEVCKALTDYQADEGKFKSFSEVYKVLRSMLYLRKKGQSGPGNGE